MNIEKKLKQIFIDYYYISICLINLLVNPENDKTSETNSILLCKLF